MVRKRKLGARTYKDYTNEVLDQALSKVTEEGWSLQRASREYKIPYGTLNNKFHGRCIRKNGRQTVFSMSEEKVFISAAITCGDWGFPLEAADLRQFAKNYLDSQGRNIAIFSNNLPGNDWMYSMLKRHNNAIVRKMAANIKRSRASVSRDGIKNYFDNLPTSLQNVHHRDKLDVQPGKSFTGPESSPDEEQETAAVLEKSPDDAVSEQLEEETEYFSVENDNLTIGAYWLVHVAGGSRKKNNVYICCHYSKCHR
nr:unnamed protein product [Callosobruchus analis]